MACAVPLLDGWLHSDDGKAQHAEWDRMLAPFAAPIVAQKPAALAPAPKPVVALSPTEELPPSALPIVAGEELPPSALPIVAGAELPGLPPSAVPIVVSAELPPTAVPIVQPVMQTTTTSLPDPKSVPRVTVSPPWGRAGTGVPRTAAQALPVPTSALPAAVPAPLPLRQTAKVPLPGSAPARMMKIAPLSLAAPGCDWPQPQKKKGDARQAKDAKDMGERRYSGVVKSYNAQSGFGFINCQETYAEYQRDVFLHRNQFAGLAIGQFVEFDVEMKHEGRPQARRVRRVPIGVTPGHSLLRGLINKSPQKQATESLLSPQAPLQQDTESLPSARSYSTDSADATAYSAAPSPSNQGRGQDESDDDDAAQSCVSMFDDACPPALVDDDDDDEQ